MALVTTPGASNADSYAALAAAGTYFSSRGIAAWTGTDAEKEAALRRATTYLDNQYRGRWLGVRATEDQSLAWPRVDGARGWGGGFTEPLYDADGFAIPVDEVPLQVQHATMECALLVVQGVALEPRLERGGGVKRLRKKVGPLEKETEWADGAPTMDRLTVVEGLLRDLVTSSPGSSAGNVRLVRA